MRNGASLWATHPRLPMKRLLLSGIAALFLATGAAQAQQFIAGPGAGIGRSQYVGSSIRFTPQEAGCYRANSLSTFAMQRRADQVRARLTVAPLNKCRNAYPQKNQLWAQRAFF